MDFHVFFNEASTFSDNENISESELRIVAKNLVQCIIKIIAINKSSKILYFSPLSELTIGQNTLASLLNIPNAREYWDRIRHSYLNANVFYEDTLTIIENCQYLELGKFSCRGGLMALLQDTIILSLNLNQHFQVHEINGKHYTLENDGTSDVKINNVYKDNIPEAICELIKNYGTPSSKSTTIYSGDNFLVQMYVNDHNPPHVHVYSTGNKLNILARVNIRNFDLMDGSENVQPVRKELLAWIEKNQEQLLSNWDLCQRGNFPREIIPN